MNKTNADEKSHKTTASVYVFESIPHGASGLSCSMDVMFSVCNKADLIVGQFTGVCFVCTPDGAFSLHFTMCCTSVWAWVCA